MTWGRWSLQKPVFGALYGISTDERQKTPAEAGLNSSGHANNIHQN